MSTPGPWFHHEISRVQAEELLARAGRDGSYLVRASESVAGAYALCLLFQRHVHTYRILPDAEGLLAVQTMQGVQVNCFRTLEELVMGYQHPHKGLVTPLQYPVSRVTDPGDESSDEEKPAPVPASFNTAASSTAAQARTPSHLPFLHKLQELNTTSISGDVMGLLTDYLHKDLPLDIESVFKGATCLRNLQHTLGTTCQGLNSEIDLTLSSLETLAKVFDHPTSPLCNKSQGPEMELDSLLCKISALVSLLSSLEKRVLKALQDAVTNHNLAVQPAPPPPEPPAVTVNTARSNARPLPVHAFQVKMARYGRQTVSVDVDTGVLLFDKKTGTFGVETISHERVLQVVQFHASPAKLRLAVDGHHSTPRELTFQSARKREAFCMLLQLMKTRHAKLGEPDLLSVFVGTWNMGGSPPPRDLTSWVTCCGLGRTPDESTASLAHDVYALGTQENPQGEREWTEHLRTTLRGCTHLDYKQVAVQSLWNMRLVVLVKPEHEGRISHVNTASVKTGLGNTLGNKGAVGVSFHFNGTSFGFVNCHLSSGSEKVIRRNQNFVDILRLLSLGDKQLNAFDISLRFTHLFWCGDLNYRLDLDVQDILKHVSKREFEELMCADQLTRERQKNKAFLNFKEEKICFPPTYRYERGSRGCYLWQKYKTSGVRVNVPSWCDRVLWRTYPEAHLNCTSYGCTDDIFTSDHSPVFGTFEVGVSSLPGSKTADQKSSTERARIELERLEAIVKTASKSKFFVEFHSACLEETRRSSENDSQSCDVPGFLKLGWSAKQLPKLLPVASDVDYLQDQHLLLSIKSCDGFESYGECCVALRSPSGPLEQFETFLSHRGEEMGTIRGHVKVHVPADYRRAARSKIYECFCFEKDDKGPGRGPPVALPSIQALVHNPSHPKPSSYTNPAYFIFEGISVAPRAADPPPKPRAPQVVWSGDEALQLPKLTAAGNAPDGKSARRSNFTEIEIPNAPSPYSQINDLHLHHHTNSSNSYQLFPSKSPPPLPPAQSQSIAHAHEHLPQAKAKGPGVAPMVAHTPAPGKNLASMYVNHPAIPRESPRRDPPMPPPERAGPLQGLKHPSLFPYASTRLPLACKASAPWKVEQQHRQQQHQQHAARPAGDHSLTALQIAKSLSEMDFFPPDMGSQYVAQQRSGQRNGPGTPAERGYCRENEVSVLRGAPETVRELLGMLGLQKYTLGLSLHGWDDLDYFSGITEEDLRAAGVLNPSHRRRILENLPRILENLPSIWN
ncbi:inositol polyphosphate phosphatase-like 1b isoform X1 [Gadus chalcogrammus]|uniref:inositol polyphosphate phosphatase-like 1b isoform X1 n=2 Tax=Gadus chalcogrammus TaxID=1042646 RepID=UPI0024C4B930|nr:inositol polyphosphate phosphatase-like 1b isoform X1 [Gadus chalcogrammus]